jgi:SAM-dependent methyltransferase
MNLQQFINENDWSFCGNKSHCSIIDKNANHAIRFDLFVAFIKQNGIMMRINENATQVLILENHYYWVTNTIGRMKHTIINRERISDITNYVNIEDYDSLFDNDFYAEEDIAICEMIGDLHGSVLDVGCGTGLLLQIKDIKDYKGIDTSPLMINKLIEKFPDRKHQVMICKVEEYVKTKRTYDNVIALFSASYILSPRVFMELWNGNGKLFLIFYKEDYTPVTHHKLGINAPYSKFTKKELEQIFPNQVKEFNNYYIVQS